MSVGDLNFGQALALLKAGFKITRTGWGAAGAWLALQEPSKHSSAHQRLFFMFFTDDHPVRWKATDVDLLATDWRVIE
jgi:uncharacterized protein DUF2829